MNEPHEHEDETHEDEADGDGADERSFAREALEADERVRRLRESLGRQQAQSVGVFDQFLAGLVELEHTVDGSRSSSSPRASGSSSSARSRT